MGGVVVIRLPLIAVVPMAGFDPRLRYFMWVENVCWFSPLPQGFWLIYQGKRYYSLKFNSYQVVFYEISCKAEGRACIFLKWFQFSLCSFTIV
jgi:hypothetical protein